MGRPPADRPIRLAASSRRHGNGGYALVRHGGWPSASSSHVVYTIARETCSEASDAGSLRRWRSTAGPLCADTERQQTPGARQKLSVLFMTNRWCLDVRYPYLVVTGQCGSSTSALVTDRPQEDPQDLPPTSLVHRGHPRDYHHRHPSGPYQDSNRATMEVDPHREESLDNCDCLRTAATPTPRCSTPADDG